MSPKGRNQTTSRCFILASCLLQWMCPCHVLPGETGGPHIASAWALPGCISLLPSALQLEERVKSQKHRVNRNICTRWQTACVFFLSLQLTNRTAPLYNGTCNDEEQTDGWGKQNSLSVSSSSSSLSSSLQIRPASGGWCLVRVSGEVVWVLLMTAGWWWGWEQLPKPPISLLTTLNDSRLTTSCVFIYTLT